MALKRIKLVLAYDGSPFQGWQWQPKGMTVQGEVEGALEKLFTRPLRVQGAGRTDRGVHAMGQVAHLDIPEGFDERKLVTGLNHFLHPAVRVLQAEEKPGFHARFDALEKTYRYLIDRSEHPMPWDRKYRYFYSAPLDLSAMREASCYFLGEHDFTSFRGPRSGDVNPVRTIESLDIWEEDRLLIFEVKGQSFLRNMVRILAGTLLEVGEKRRSPQEIPAIIRSKRREAAGPTLPPEGLYLTKIRYEEE